MRPVGDIDRGQSGRSRHAAQVAQEPNQRMGAEAHRGHGHQRRCDGRRPGRTGCVMGSTQATFAVHASLRTGLSRKRRSYAGQRCGGVQIPITDWSKFEALNLGVALALTLRKLYPERWNPAAILRIRGHRPAYEAIRKGRRAEAVENCWWVGLQQLHKVRARHLLYK